MNQPTVRKLSADAPPFIPQIQIPTQKLNANAKAFVPSNPLITNTLPTAIVPPTKPIEPQDKKVQPVNTEATAPKENVKVEIKVEAQNKPHEKKLEAPKLPTKKIIYERAFLLTYREKCKKRPFHMKEINIPLQQWTPPVVDDQRIRNIKEIRNMLNKFAKTNYLEYTKQILSKEYSAEELSEIAKLLFNKSTKESSYVEFYMELCDQMMRKYKEKEPNFRKMFISKCQSLFEEGKQCEYDSTLKDVDEEERKEKNKTRLLNNIKLIGELFVRGAMGEAILQSIIEKLMKEKSEVAVENLCNVFIRIGESVYSAYAYQQEQTSKKKKPQIKLKSMNKEVFDDYIDRMMEFKNDEKISSRIKLLIQDIADARDNKWIKAFDEFVVKENSSNKVVFIPKQNKEEAKEKVEQTQDTIDPKVLQREILKKSLNEVSVLGIGLEPFTNVKLDEKSRVYSIIGLKRKTL